MLLAQQDASSNLGLELIEFLMVFHFTRFEASNFNLSDILNTKTRILRIHLGLLLGILLISFSELNRKTSQ